MRKIVLYSLLFLLPGALCAQSRESADRSGASLQAGAEYSIFNPDFYCTSSSPFSCGGGGKLLKGVGVFADYDLRGKYGAEAEGRWLHWDGEGGQVESTYLIGPRYRVYRWHSLDLWAKFMVGIGGITTAYYPAPDTLKGTMFVYAPGASVDYRLTRKVSIRGDYELQKWPAFAVTPPHNHGLTPNGFSLGIAYSVF